MRYNPKVSPHHFNFHTSLQWYKIRSIFTIFIQFVLDAISFHHWWVHTANLLGRGTMETLVWRPPKTSNLNQCSSLGFGIEMIVKLIPYSPNSFYQVFVCTKRREIWSKRVSFSKSFFKRITESLISRGGPKSFQWNVEERRQMLRKSISKKVQLFS